ncbi:MAG: S8 family serine peptidase [Bryobacteraceae bacterium]
MGRVLALALLLGGSLCAERYALILSDPPALKGPRTAVRAAQSTLRRELAARGFRETGSVERILNAVFVQTTPDRVDELKGLPGVAGVVRMRMRYPKLNRAVELVNAPAAWNALGGVQNAGEGMKIAIIDSGIDQNHPAFQDPTLTPPAGYPICQGGDCSFTNSKVIVARSYIRQVAAGFGANPAAESRPDDYTPRDHVGHGTALGMIAAGNTNTGPAATITGMAPRAFLGNYKIFGTPAINGGTSSDVIIQALEDALNDGMDVAVLSLGGPAFTAPLDRGAACGLSGNTPCDPEAVAIENVIAAGLSVVAAAGNEGDLGATAPTRGTIDSPAYAPSVIAAGASTNAHTFLNSLRVPGGGVPSGLQQIPAVFGDGPLPAAPLTAPLIDVATLGDSGLACAALPQDSLRSAFALIQRGVCTFLQKVQNAQLAGASGVVLYQQTGVDAVLVPGGLQDLRIPALMIGFTAGAALKSFISANPGREVTMDPNLAEAPVNPFNEVAGFSSRGPSIDGALKPDLVAVGSNVYVATESTDPDGPMYDASGYTVEQGTSFSTPMVAGAVALVKQRNPRFGPAQLKSAVVNTATRDVTEDGRAASAISVGAGKLDTNAAVNTNITVQPAVLALGVIRSVPVARQLTFTNSGTAAASLTLQVTPRVADPQASLRLDRGTLSLAPGASGTVTVTLQGSQPGPGAYEGDILVQGGTVPVHIPYLYLAGDGQPANIFPLIGYDVVGAAGADNPDGGIAFRVVDRYGVGVSGVPVTFRVTRGGGTVYQPDARTDQYGIAGAGATFGPFAGPQQFVATAGGLTQTFDASARTRPTISTGGVVNAATFLPSPGVAPGSYITIFGTALSDQIGTARSASLPFSLGGASVAFDAEEVSVAGRLYYASPTQINVQVPWELAGKRSVQMKVDVGRVSGRLVTLNLTDVAPGVFEYAESTGVLLAAALDLNFGVIGTNNPAARGSAIQLYCNGLGPVDNTPPTGEPAPVSPLARTFAQPTVTIGGRPAAVGFSGLAPGFSGLYQVNVTVPSDAPTGVQPLILTVNGIPAKTVNLPVR